HVSEKTIHDFSHVGALDRQWCTGSASVCFCNVFVYIRKICTDSTIHKMSAGRIGEVRQF
ncbi:hypothetical protein BgiMline_020114, partial [Biomphalaria glabrata]